MNRNRRQFLSWSVSSGTIAGLAASIPLARAEEPVAAAATKEATTVSTQVPPLTVWQLSNRTHSQMESYILWCCDGQNAADGKLIVIDGGVAGDRDYLVDMIQVMRALKTDKPCKVAKVDAWYLTHDHSDHTFALATLLEEKRANLEIGQIYYAFPPIEWMDQNEHAWIEEARYSRKNLGAASNTTTVKMNDTWQFGAVTITALNDFDLSITQNAVNNSSIVYRVSTPNSSILFLGDLGVEGGERLLKLQPKEKITADAVQMAHHGQQGVNRAFYEAVSPKICFWPTPDWLWMNDAGKGPGTGPWKTFETRKWVEEMGITTHYVAQDGFVSVDFN